MHILLKKIIKKKVTTGNLLNTKKINRQYVGNNSGEEIYALFSNKTTTI